MKKIWKIRKDKEGVSPVIATILMVAITVVLAAVLYVMVIGIGTPPELAGAGSWTEVEAVSETEGIATFGQFDNAPQPTTIKIFIKANETAVGYITWGSNTDSSLVNWNDAPNGASVAYNDYNEAGGYINLGDYLEFSGLLPGTTYALEVFNIQSDSIISMVGDSDFVTPS